LVQTRYIQVRYSFRRICNEICDVGVAKESIDEGKGFCAEESSFVTEGEEVAQVLGSEGLDGPNWEFQYFVDCVNDPANGY
jgi:hypothetical protein